MNLSLPEDSPPVVIIGPIGHAGIGIARSLGRLGVRIYAIDYERTPTLFSRYCRGSFLWDLRTSPAEESVQFLLSIARSIGGRAVLVPTSDIGTIFIADHQDRLRGPFSFPDRNAALIRSLCSKKEMYFLAQRHGIPTPEASFPQSREDVLRFIEAARFPVLLKAIHGRLSGRKPMWLVHSRKELLGNYDALEYPSRPNLMLQEYIPGPDNATWTFNGYFDGSGECRVAFTGTKLRNYPAYFGQASLGICVHNPEVAAMTICFMKAIRYKGPLDLGYRYDARDGRYKVNDINPRIGAMFRLFVGANGMDVVRALYQDMTGQPVIPSSTQDGRKWIVETWDFLASLRYYRDGNLRLSEWSKSLRGIDEFTYLTLDDPMPLAGLALQAGNRALRAIRASRMMPKRAAALGAPRYRQ